MTSPPRKTTPHVMIDLETFGNGNNAVIVSLGAVKFTGSRILERFHAGINPESCTAAGLDIDADTVLWWLDPERAAARDQLIALDKVDLFYALDGFAQWYSTPPTTETGDIPLPGDQAHAPGAELPIWGNGATFDNVILRSAYKAVNLEYPAPFWLDRCYRTMKSMVPNTKLKRVGTHHNAADDAESQAWHLMEIWKQLGIDA